MENRELDADRAEQADAGGQRRRQAVQRELAVNRVPARPIKVDERRGKHRADPFLAAEQKAELDGP